MQSDKVRDLTKMAMCVALCCVTAYISFPLPFTPGMVTALTFALSLTAYLLTPRQTFTVILIYILLGAAGLPVFAGGQGLSRLLGPAGGFYFAWLFAYTALSFAKSAKPNFKRYLSANILIAVVKKSLFLLKERHRLKFTVSTLLSLRLLLKLLFQIMALRVISERI